MKVLLVEDSTTKAVAIQTFVASISQSITLSHVRSAHAAVQMDEHETFSAYILDLVLPRRQGEAPTTETGIWLANRLAAKCDSSPCPRVALLSQYEESLREAEERGVLPQHLLNVPYSEGTSDWKELLASWLRRHLRLEAPVPPGQGFRARAVIINALAGVELAASRDAFPAVNAIHPDSALYEYLVDSPENPQVCLISPGEVGMIASALAVSDAVARFRPQYVLMGGIAAGFARHTHIGDLLLAERTWNWESGRWSTGENGEELFEPSPAQVIVDASLAAHVRRVLTPEVLAELHDHWPDRKPPAAPTLMCGPIASGGAVIANKRLLNAIAAQNRSVIGLDMEAHGVAYACYRASAPAPLCLVLKCVSDLGDEHKSNDFQAYASYVSAHAIRAVLDQLPQR